MDEPRALAPSTPPLSETVVVEWLLTGASESQVREALLEKYPGADHEKGMATAYAYLRTAGQPNVDAVRGWALLCYRNLYQRMLQIGDYDGCRKVLKEIVALIP